MEFNDLLKSIQQSQDCFELPTGEFVVVLKVKGLHIMQAMAAMRQNPELDYTACLIMLCTQVDGVKPNWEWLYDIPGRSYMRLADAICNQITDK